MGEKKLIMPFYKIYMNSVTAEINCNVYHLVSQRSIWLFRMTLFSILYFSMHLFNIKNDKNYTQKNIW